MISFMLIIHDLALSPLDTEPEIHKCRPTTAGCRFYNIPAYIKRNQTQFFFQKEA
jgi:hypothetical protein